MIVKTSCVLIANVLFSELIRQRAHSLDAVADKIRLDVLSTPPRRIAPQLGVIDARANLMEQRAQLGGLVKQPARKALITHASRHSQFCEYDYSLSAVGPGKHWFTPKSALSFNHRLLSSSTTSLSSV